MRYISLDLVRCVAICLLLMSHIGQTIGSPLGIFFGIPHFYHVSFGGLAVTIFLILSGIVLELQYGNKNINTPKFLIKRILRIYPVYYLSLLFGIVVYSMKSYYYTGNIISNFSSLGVHDIILCITGAYAFVGEWGGPFVDTSWFIALIITLYLFYPFLSIKIKKNPNTYICVIFFISVLSRLILGKYQILPMRPLDWFPLSRIFEFSLGIYLVTILPQKAFNLLESKKPYSFLISFLSTLSFPLFLVHAPFLFIIKYLPMRGTNHLLSILCYLSVSVLFSWILLEIDKRFPRSFLLERVEDILMRYKHRLSSN